MKTPSLESLPETARLSGAELSALSATRASRWRPGLGGAHHSEVFASGREAAGAGLAMALALDTLRTRAAKQATDPASETEDRRAILWVQDKSAIRLTGRPYRPGLPEELQGRVIHVRAETAQDALFALEEGVRCRDLACVIGELVGQSARARLHGLAPPQHGGGTAWRAAVAGPDRCRARPVFRSPSLGNALGPVCHTRMEPAGTGRTGMGGRTVPCAQPCTGGVDAERA